MIYWIIGGAALCIVSFFIGKVIGWACAEPYTPIINPESVSQTVHDRLCELEKITESNDHMANFIFGGISLWIWDDKIELNPTCAQPAWGDPKIIIISIADLIVKILETYKIEIKEATQAELKLKVKK